MRNILVLFILSFMTFSSLQAQGNNVDDKVLKHVNPMPNLMRVVMKYKDELQLTENQITAINLWKQSNKPRIKKLIQKVMEQEKNLHEMALNSDSHLVAEAQKMLDNRKNIIILKAQCRANLKSFLKKEQWEKLLELYKKANS